MDRSFQKCIVLVSFLRPLACILVYKWSLFVLAVHSLLSCLFTISQKSAPYIYKASHIAFLSANRIRAAVTGATVRESLAGYIIGVTSAKHLLPYGRVDPMDIIHALDAGTGVAGTQRGCGLWLTLSTGGSRAPPCRCFSCQRLVSCSSQCHYAQIRPPGAD